jgi:hypothetical protein
MANVLSGNTFYIDSQHAAPSDALDRKQVIVTHIIVTSTASSGRIVLVDNNNSADIKLDLRLKDGGESKHFDFEESPVLFPNGIKVPVLANAIATLIIRSPGG